MSPFKDPVKRKYLENYPNTLLRHMPYALQESLFFGRANLQSLYDALEKLAFMGLVSFEQISTLQSMNQNSYQMFSPGLAKDVFDVYIHENASILDTRRCEENYMFINNPEMFQRIFYKLDSLAKIEEYWTELQGIVLKNLRTESTFFRNYFSKLLQLFVREQDLIVGRTKMTNCSPAKGI